jgi:hypothetical protein
VNPQTNEEIRPVPVEVVGDRAEGWVGAMGLRVRVCAAAESRHLLARLLAPWAESGPEAGDGAGRRIVLPAGPEGADAAAPHACPEVDLGILTEASAERVASVLSTRVTLAALEHHRGAHLLFHAGGIADERGRVAVIVGPSGRGKTTTTRRLAQEYGYVSDETITLTGDGVVLPYRKPLSVITEGHAHKLQIAPSALGLLPLPDAKLRVAGLVLLERRDDGAAKSAVTPVPLAEALVELVQQTSYLAELPHPLRRIAETARATGGIRRLHAGAPERIAEAAPALFAPGVCERWEQVLPMGPGEGGARRAGARGTGARDASASSQRTLGAEPGERGVEPGDSTGPGPAGLPFAAAPVLDAIECESGTVVFSEDRQVRLLSGLGSVLWRGVCEGDDWEALEARVIAQLGTPPDGDLRSAVLEACEALVEAEVFASRPRE